MTPLIARSGPYSIGRSEPITRQQRFGQTLQARLDPAGDVEDGIRDPCFDGQHVGARDIGDADEVHRLRAVTEDQRRFATGDSLDPTDQDLRVGAVDVHPRAVDVEVTQRDIVEAGHRVVAAQQSLVEGLGGAVERVVRVWMVVLVSRGRLRRGRRPTPRRRRSACRTPASAAASITLNVPSTRTSSASRGSSAHWVIRIAAWWKTMFVPAVSSSTRARSRTSPSTTVRLPFSSAQLRFSRLPRTKLSRMRISSAPRSTSWSTRVEPIVPAPPVTRIRPPLTVAGFAWLFPLVPIVSRGLPALGINGRELLKFPRRFRAL